MVITCFGSSPASGGPPLGGRAGERIALMLSLFELFPIRRFLLTILGLHSVLLTKKRLFLCFY